MFHKGWKEHLEMEWNESANYMCTSVLKWKHIWTLDLAAHALDSKMPQTSIYKHANTSKW